MITRSTASRCRGLLLALCVTSAPALAAPIVLAPSLAGQYQAGIGVDAQLLKVRDSWRGSGVLYDPETDQLGVGRQTIGNFRGGAGLWGLVDWNTAHHAPAAGMVERGWSGRAAQVAFGDDVFNDVHGGDWGTVPLAPLFAPGDTSPQDNWTARFYGYIRITEAGLYNFGVLHDDGFFFDLHGAGGQQASMFNDFLNPPNRMSFADGLRLDAGLYAFELGAYEHLEAGVVELSWKRGASDWSRVPTDHLVAFADAAAVPEPASWLMALGGLLALGATRRTRRLGAS